MEIYERVQAIKNVANQTDLFYGDEAKRHQAKLMRKAKAKLKRDLKEQEQAKALASRQKGGQRRAQAEK